MPRAKRPRYANVCSAAYSSTYSAKRPRYADVYSAAYSCFCFPMFVSNELERFRRAPAHLVNVPRYIETLIRTQAPFERYRETEMTPVRWALAVSNLMRKRAARIITHAALAFVYHPRGPWLRKQKALWASGACTAEWLRFSPSWVQEAHA